MPMNAPGPILTVYRWYEGRNEGEEPNADGPGAWWGQLAGGMVRLLTVQEELEAVRRLRDVEKALRRLELYLEVYLARAFEIRERALGLLQSLTYPTENSKEARVFRDKLRHRNQKFFPEALDKLNLMNTETSSALAELLDFLEKDVPLRNEHTHQYYVTVGVGDELFDPYDALLDLSTKPVELRKLKRLLLCGIRQMSDDYLTKISNVLVLTRKVLDASSVLLPAFSGPVRR